MRTRLPWILLPVILVSAGCQQKENLTGFKCYGAKIDVAQPMPLHELVAQADELGDRRVWVKADIKTVCEKMGCWMMLTDGENNVRTRFTESDSCKDGFFVPRNAAGHTVYAHGFVNCGEISEADARHYAEDEGKAEAEIAKIVGPQKVVTFFADGVMISDAKKLDPPMS